MKKLSLLSLFFVAVLAITSCKKDEETTPGNNTGGNNTPTGIQQEQKAVAFYLSGNWCGPCGQYGKPAMASITSKNPTKLVVVACHLNGAGGAMDPYTNADANALASAWAVTGVPTCAIGGAGEPAQKIGGGTAMEASITTQLNTIIAKKASANSSIDISWDASDLITVKTKTKFFEASADAYSISVYVIENGIKGRQFASNTGWDENATHNHVLRKKVSTSVTGDALITGVTAGQEVEKTFQTSVEPEPAWKHSNVQVVAVLWKQGGTGKLLVNATVKNLK